MVTKRTPIKRNLRRRITPEAIEAFRRMEAATSDDEWSEAHSVLHRALKLPPWEWPAFEYPDDECPYPEGCHAAEYWAKDRSERPKAFALYEELRLAAVMC